MATYLIRKARPEDCEEVVRLMYELASYSLTITPDKLRADVFCDHPFAEAFVAICTESNEMVAYSSFSYMYNTWKERSVFMDDLYVAPDHRGKGVGTSLMQAVAKHAFKQRGCVRMHLIAYTWNKRAQELYKRLGCENLTVRDQWENLTLPPESFHKFITNHQVKLGPNTTVDVEL